MTYPFFRISNYTWDGKVTIVRDARRARYCLDALRKKVRDSGELNKFVNDMEVALSGGYVLTEQQAHALEAYYRGVVLRQRVAEATEKDIA